MVRVSPWSGVGVGMGGGGVGSYNLGIMKERFKSKKRSIAVSKEGSAW